MKFTLSWLKDHLETDATLETIERTLSSIGLEVEGIENPADTLGDFTIARIVEAKQHPDADRLRVCQVEIQPGQPTVEVVCGAPNAKPGLVGVFGPIGSYIPGTGITLEKRPVRGIDSNGMMLSERELEISEDHDGIIELDPAAGDRIGERYIDIAGLNDPVLEIAITPNRPDCTGVRGVARDLAAAGVGVLKPEPVLKHEVEGEYESPVDIQLEFSPDAADACPVFAGRYVRGVTNGPAPAWMQQRLKAAGLRPISALVDMTNYVSLDRGRPLHVYDADKLQGHIRARLGKAGEEFEALDNKSYVSDDEMCVIADDSGPLGFGGIIGGESTGCTPETKNVLIECAYFDPTRTASTGRKAGIITDARYRFERGVDPTFVVPGLDLATEWVLELCGGTPSKAKIAGEPPQGGTVISFDYGKVKRLTGVDIPVADGKRILEAIGCELAGKGPQWKVTTPPWRPDMHGPADVVEEVIRIFGLDNVPPVAMERSHGVTRSVLTNGQRRARRARRTLAGRGLVEAVTWSFIPQEQAEHFGGGAEPLKLANPISIELSTMRPGLLAGLLVAAQRNRNRGFDDVALFELGQAYLDDTPDGQMQLASGVRLGRSQLAGSGRDWRGNASDADAFDVKADAAALLSALGLDVSKVQVTRDAPAWFHPGKSGVIRLGPKMVLAHFGEVHPATLKLLDIDGAASAFEVFLHALPPEKRKARARAPLNASDLLPVRRDFAFVVDKATEAGAMIRAATGAEKALISNVSVFDVFEGKALGEDKKSVAIEVTLQPTTKTLTDAEIDKVSEKVIAAVQKATGAAIRG
ncbi:MAG: phenylalanine--tRNA ligase subunit beta [Hyphomicrobiaceae bacterium]